MKLYLAPMEALTGYVFRTAYNRFFGDADRYFTPFIASKKLSSKEKNDVIPEHNVGMEVIPQILTNKAEEFCYIADRLKEYYGYDEVNLNLGCPSGTVVAKNRGSGFLRVLPELRAFLDVIYGRCSTKISIKTRLGVDDADSFGEIISLFNDYPLSELIIHPRCRKDGYAGKPNLDAFKIAVNDSRHSLCYNGDVRTVEDYNKITEMFPTVEKIMCGRGLLSNPGLFGEIKGKEKTDKETIRRFAKEICDGYREIMSGDRNVLFKMKELWIYLAVNFDEPEKIIKKVRKAETLAEYEAVLQSLAK